MRFQVHDPDSGQTVTIEGDSTPTEQELQDIFSAVNKPKEETQPAYELKPPPDFVPPVPEYGGGMTPVMAGTTFEETAPGVALQEPGLGREAWEIGKEMVGTLGNIARAIPADVAAGVSLLKRPENQPTTLFPSPTAIAGAVEKNLPHAIETAGNIPAALIGEPLPIDKQLSEASTESVPAATLGKISQGIAATAPMAVIGALPSVLQKAALLAFTAKMVSDVPQLATELGTELGKPKEEQDPDKISSLVSDAIQATGFTVLVGTHLAKTGLRGAIDFIKPKPTGEPYASQITEATGIPQLAVRPRMGEETPLRQPRETPGTRIPERSPETQALPPEQPQAVVEPTPTAQPELVGMGGAVPAEAKYAAIQELVDRINTAPPTPTPEAKLNLNERIADQWGAGKSLIDRTTAKLTAIGQSLKDTARGVREIKDLDRTVAALDWSLQRSSAESLRAKQSIAKQIKDRTSRDATAIWQDTPGTDAEKIAAIQDTLNNLPKGTPNRVARALQRATNLSEAERDFAASQQAYFSRRLADAQESGVLENGLEDYFTHIWRKAENMPDNLRAALTNGRLSTYFKYARERKIPTFLEGIRMGKVPEFDPADVIPLYNYTLDRAIASREFIRSASDLTESDGKPTLSPAGRSVPVEKAGTPERLIIKPRARSEENALYRQIDHPALRKWKWGGTDENGNPVLYQSDLLVHPDAYERMARFLDRGRMTPTKAGRIALGLSTQVKGLKLGLISAFHAVHTGSHALFHWTNPFRAARNAINWESPETRFAVEKGHLKLAPDPAELKIVSEGIVPGRLVEQIPVLGPWSRAWSEYQFGELIPRWKLATFRNAYPRNIWARDNLPGAVSGLKGLTDEQVAARVGDSVNNAYGELNHLFLGKYGRDPRLQRILRGIFLAPDFGEARLRFVEKAATKTGLEERIALATMFLSLYSAARAMNWASHGDPEMDWKKAFSVKFGDHWWSMRSVVADLDHMMANFGQFMYVRLNPVYARTISDVIFSRDVQGRKLSNTQKFVTRPLNQLIPIQFGGLTRDDQKVWESFVTAMGVQTRRDSPSQDVLDLVNKWKETNTNPKIRESYERAQQEVYAKSPYAPLRTALRMDDPGAAAVEYDKLLETRKPWEITRSMTRFRPFTGSATTELKFRRQLTPPQAGLYRDAINEQHELADKYRKFQAGHRPTNLPTTLPSFKPPEEPKQPTTPIRQVLINQ